jgi:hypothetical protein
MAFTDFSLSSAVKAFELTVTQHLLFAEVSPVSPSAWLLEALKRGMPLAFTSEKSRSEYLIAPVLSDVRQMATDKISVYSGQRLDVDAERGLVGECDFIISNTAQNPLLQAPIISVVEAKRQDIELGYGQTVAQMVASQQFNLREAQPFSVLYGCVSTGEAWQFLRLEDRRLEIDSSRYYLNQLPELLGVFRTILATYI